jgi:hypothetical protein
MNRISKPWVKEQKPVDVKDPPANNIAELKAAGKCFECRELWSPGHAKVCKAKQTFSMILVENSKGKEEIAVVDDSTQSEDGEYFDAQPASVVQVSLHALCGTMPLAHPFTLKLHIGNSSAIALVDSGSDISFISAKFATRNNCKISATSPIQVAAANGSNRISESACLACQYQIQGHTFSSDIRLLEVQGYDIISGADWIYTHSPLGLDLKTRQLSVTKYGEQVVTFIDESVPDKNLMIGARKLCQLLKKKAFCNVVVLNNSDLKQTKPSPPKIPETIQVLLQEFGDVFVEPKDLPPK